MPAEGYVPTCLGRIQSLTRLKPLSVEQILGRVLRMPRAQRKRRDALNQSYAFIVSRSFDTTAQQLRDGLVEGAGFNPMEAAQIIAPQQNLEFANEQGTPPARDAYREAV